MKGVTPKDNFVVTHPKVAAEWYQQKNGDRRPEEFTYGCRYKAWWRCFNGHEWQVSIHSRTQGKGSSCPYCGTHPVRVSIDNCLASRYPKIALQWNSKNTFTPYDVLPFSSVRVWWQCLSGHEWQTQVRTATINHGVCQQCYFLRNRGENNSKWKGCGEMSGKYFAQIKHNIATRNKTRKTILKLEVSEEYCWNLFLHQNRRCALTNRELSLIAPQTASLDRIDSSKDYKEGNIQWIHKDLQSMKWNFDENYFVKMCCEVAVFKGKMTNELTG